MDLINKTDIKRALADFSMCPYFPADPATQAAVGVFLARICPHREALEWLVLTFINRVGKWQGPVELRGVLATRYRPADGVEAYSTIAGFTSEESEAAQFEQHQQIKQGGWLPEGERPSEMELIDRQLRKLCGKVM